MACSGGRSTLGFPALVHRVCCPHRWPFREVSGHERRARRCCTDSRGTEPARSSASPATSRCPSKVAEESRILPLHTLSHEPAVGFAADAAGRFRGTIGVAAVTYGAGAFNLVNAVSVPSPKNRRGGRFPAPPAGPRPLRPAAAPSGRSTRSSASTRRSPAPRRGWTTPPPRRPRSRACSPPPSTRPGRSISSCRATWWASPVALSRPTSPHRRTPTRSPPAPTRSWFGWPRPSGPWSWWTSRCAATASRPRSPSHPKAGHPGRHHLHGPRLAPTTGAPLAGTYLGGVAGDPGPQALVEGRAVSCCWA